MGFRPTAFLPYQEFLKTFRVDNNEHEMDDRAVYAEIVDFDDMFHREAAAQQPIMITDFDITRAEDKERLNRVLMTRYTGDALDVVPKCDCEKLYGEFNVGTVCAICRTAVDHVTERELKPSLWLEAPKGVEAFVNPHVWTMFKQALGTSTSNVLEYLTNPYYRPSSVTPVLRKVMDLKIERGLNNFVRNFDSIMAQLFSKRGIIVPAKKPVLEAFIQRYRHALFCRYLPVPSKLTFITELNAGVTYTDKTITLALDAVRTINYIASSVIPLKPKEIESKTVMALNLLSNYYWTFAGKPTGGKPAILRQHVFGFRPHFTARCVISSLAGEHKHDELVIPWGVAIQLFKIHLTGLLMKRTNMTPNEISRLLHENVNQRHPLLVSLVDELLNTGDGMWCTLGRNPSLARGSIQFFRISAVWEDPNINTFGLSVLVLSACNGDYDGDELNLMLILDRAMRAKMARLSPYLSLMDLKSPWTISGNQKIHGPIISTMTNWRRLAAA